MHPSHTCFSLPIRAIRALVPLMPLMLLMSAACSETPNDGVKDKSKSAEKAEFLGKSQLGWRFSLASGVDVEVLPAARIDGQWVTGKDALGATLVHGTGGNAPLANGVTLQLAIKAKQDVVIEAMELRVKTAIGASDVRGWLSNGFQSWSQSGAVKLGPGSDDLRKLPEARRKWPIDPGLDIAPAIRGRATEPIDYFPENPPSTLANAAFDHIEGKSRHVVPQRWHAPDGAASGEVLANASAVTVTIAGVAVPPHSIHRVSP